MRAEIQILSGLWVGCIRIWDNPLHGYGDPYQRAATVLATQEEQQSELVTRLEVIGVTQAWERAHWRAAMFAGGQVGGDIIGFRRIKDGRTRENWFATK